MRGGPGDLVRVEVAHAGLPRVVREWRLRERSWTEESWTQALARHATNLFPVLFVAVGLGVLFLRWEDRHAWLLALLFGGFIAGPPIAELEWLIHPTLRGFAAAYRTIFYGLLSALTYYFFAVFPVPSPIERRVPWFKTALLWTAAAVSEIGRASCRERV